jgi:D-arabinose 1-dehydrogenase-like Zn-dependent alcohol dehydrogenase
MAANANKPQDAMEARIGYFGDCGRNWHSCKRIQSWRRSVRIAAFPNGYRYTTISTLLRGQLIGTGGISQYAKTTEDMLVLKPKAISHVEAASLGCVSLTALQSFEKVEGGLEGKTVLITSGRKYLLCNFITVAKKFI